MEKKEIVEKKEMELGWKSGYIWAKQWKFLDRRKC